MDQLPPALEELLSRLPSPSVKPVTVRVNARSAKAVRRGHPWLFDGGIERCRDDAAKVGDVAALFDVSRRRELLGLGLYDPRSPIRVKVLHSGGAQKIDAEFFRARIDAAIQRRAPLLERGDTDGYRVIYGEGDGLPGLVVDRFAETLVMKLYSATWGPWLREIIAPLFLALRPQRLVLRLSRNIQKIHDDGALRGLFDGQILAGPPLEGPVIFRENGVRFEAEPVDGQKTGFFLDQRDNRARVETLSAGHDVLNVFSYTGGFSLYAARGGARSVTDVDLNAHALASSERNFLLNQDHPAIARCHHETRQGDAFKLLSSFAARRKTWPIVIVDPPSFARKQTQVPGALSAYARLVTLSLEVLTPGGLLILASCSSRVTAESFRENAVQAGRAAGRPLRILDETQHGIDHPVLESFPEGAYLKCLYTRA